MAKTHHNNGGGVFTFRKKGIGAKKGTETPRLPQKNRGRSGKKACKSVRSEDNHENGKKQFIYAMNNKSNGKSRLYVVDEAPGSESRIRKVTPAGVVTTLFITGSYPDLDYCTGVGVDNATNLYVADNGVSVILKMTFFSTGFGPPSWQVTTVAGTVGQIGTNDGTGTNAQFNQPNAVAVDSATNLYVPDQGNNTIRKLTLSGSNWVVTTLAGLPGVIGTNDGTGANALFNYPAGVALDSAGNLYVADVNNQTIRRGFLAGGAPVILTNGAGLGFSNGLFGFNLAAAATQAVVVDASTDLVTWNSIWTNTVGTGVLPFSDPQSGTYSNCFYRAHLP